MAAEEKMLELIHPFARTTVTRSAKTPRCPGLIAMAFLGIRQALFGADVLANPERVQRSFGD